MKVRSFITKGIDNVQTGGTISKALEWAFILLICVNILYTFSGALHFPLSHVDVWANWLYKAKAISLDHGSIRFLSNWQGEFAHPQYPILLPIGYYFLYSTFNTTNEIVPSLISPLVYAAILLICFFTLRKLKFSILPALLFTYVYSMLSPLIAQGGRYHAGMPDIYLTLLCWAALLIFILSQKKVWLTWWLVPIVILGSLIKTEGVMLIFFLIVGKQKFPIKIYQVILATSGFFAWQYAINWLQIPSSYGLNNPISAMTIHKIPIITIDGFREIFGNWRNWYFFWWLFALGLLLSWPFSKFARSTLLPLLMMFSIAIVLIYTASSVPIQGYVSSSLDRLLLQISPVWFVLFALTFEKLLFEPNAPDKNNKIIQN